MKLTIIVVEPNDDYDNWYDRTTAHTIEAPDDDCDAALKAWLEHRDPSAMWVFPGEPIAFDYRAAVKAWKDAREAAELAANAEEARARKPPGFRDRELEAEKARVRRLTAELEEARATIERRNGIARNWERTASTYTPRAIRAEALLRKHGIPIPGEPTSDKDGGS